MLTRESLETKARPVLRSLYDATFEQEHALLATFALEAAIETLELIPHSAYCASRTKRDPCDCSVGITLIHLRTELSKEKR